MSFTDTITVGELHLASRVSIKADGTWVTGKVIELALLGDDMKDVRVTLLLDDETTRRFDRPPTTMVIYEWN